MLHRAALACLLLSACCCGAQGTVVRHGEPGANTAELASKLPAVLDRVKPRYVVVFAGTNDALNDGKFLSKSETAAQLRTMIGSIESSGAEAILVTLHAPDLARLMQRHAAAVYGSTPPLERVRLANEAIDEVAHDAGLKVVPFGALFERQGGATAEWSTDGVHLTAGGYRLLAHSVRDALPTVLPPGTVVLCFGDSLTFGIGVRAPGAPDNGSTYPMQLQQILGTTEIPASR